MSGKPRKRLGDILVERGLLTEDQVKIAIIEQKRTQSPLGKTLVELGFVSESVMRDFLGDVFGNQSVDLKTTVPDREAINLVPKNLAQRHLAVPVHFDFENQKLLVALTDIHNMTAIDKLRAKLPPELELVPVLASESQIRNAIDQFYGYELSVDGIINEIETGEIDYDSLDDSENKYSKPSVRLIDAILADAVKQGASDIHFEPEKSFLRLRYRIDGVLRQIRVLHRNFWSLIAVRLKVISNLNIAETRSPQDGRIHMQIGSRTIDFRVSTLPTIYGENIVLRVLDRDKSILPLEMLRLHQENLDMLKLLMSRPEGIILVTGPTGSGKTTTLYSMLNYRKSMEINITTLEDPVEYPLDLIRQTSINEVSKMDFASGIRSLMRQDPDVILVGEVRDEATAEMALRAAMTGHQVFTTLHTNSALGAIPRLTDIGVKPEIMAGNIIGIIGQRLLRTLCPKCKSPRKVLDYEKIILEVADDFIVYDKKGCEHCSHSGYKGRVSVIEVLRIDDDFNELIATGATMKALQSCAMEAGFSTMADDGLRRVKEGETTLEELSRVVDLTSKVK